MNVSDLQTIHYQLNGLAIFRQSCGLDDWIGVIDLGTAVFCLKDIGVGLKGV